ncbi:MAG TPA: hypothetical protein PK096_00150 [Candidatus Saccharibacteria bacterium]|nr:hypothetical protein [Candidatus Saccharibacteria bacterium]HRK93766.1 hypothetical protein [Candidatus Saccharibacteria bacterium]
MALKVKKRIPTPKRSDRFAQQVYKREQRRRTLRRTFTSVVVLLILAAGAGLAYTWYSGQHQTVALSEAPVHKTRATFSAPKISPNARLGVAVQTVTSPVQPGSNASITIRTNPAAVCTISVKQAEAKMEDSGLSKKTADEFGMLSWAWTVKPTDPVGKWPINITCKNKKYSAVVVSEVLVKA